MVRIALDWHETTEKERKAKGDTWRRTVYQELWQGGNTLGKAKIIDPSRVRCGGLVSALCSLEK